ncbi:MAG: Bacterial antitoxin of ParD toxin-antitoxin type system [Verrucomicrobiota bacterium]|jgi:antitoxin ParD1/3/4
MVIELVMKTELPIDSIYCNLKTMGHALTDYSEDVIARLIRTGRFNNRSEVVRAGLRLLEEKEFSYLSVKPISETALNRAYRKRTDKDESVAAKVSRRRKPSFDE